jgi:hypothetical protein
MGIKTPHEPSRKNKSPMGAQASLTAAPCSDAGCRLRALFPKTTRLLVSFPMGVFLGAPNKTRCTLFPGQEGWW